jgi:hypothetical protein
VLRRYGWWIVKRDPPAQAEFLELPFSLDALLDEVHQMLFPSVPRPAVCCAATRYIAFIQTKPNTIPPTPQIVINAVFNHKHTPVEVIRSILKHEFIHLVIDPQEIGGKRISHPPEFWEKQEQICPEMQRFWSYAYCNLMGGLINLPEDDWNEGQTLLSPRYAKRRRGDPFCSMEECLEIWGEAPTKKKEQLTSQGI